MVVHSREHALDQYEFEHFVQGCRRIPDEYQRLGAVFIAFVAGRLGLRAGEIGHMQEDWIDWRNHRINIPYHIECTKGRDGGICGTCRQQARQRVEYSQISLAEARLEALQEQLASTPTLPGQVQRQIETLHIIHIDGDLAEDALDRQLDELLTNAAAIDDADEVRDALEGVARDYQEDQQLTQEEVEAQMWQAKTENAERSVPFKWCPRATIVIEQMFDRFDEWPHSITAINRRVERGLEHAEGLDENSTMPHGLRATAASYLAGRSVAAPALQAMFGWSSMETARAYITSSPDNTQSQLQQLA